MHKILLGMSGGVDSCAAAVLLKKSGFDVAGLTLILRDGCEADVEDARRAAAMLGIEHYTLDLHEEFDRHVVCDFRNEYISGRTPNPCVQCNIHIKFGAMLDYALENGFDGIATGHYAGIGTDGNGRTALLHNPGPKDQSYFLYGLSEHQLSRSVFPLCNVTDKSEVRTICSEAGLEIAQRPDSTEICFIPDDDYVRFLIESGVESPAGDFVDTKGNVMGRHNGLIRYTVGQRKGLGAFGRPVFVTSLDPENNRIVLGDNGEQYSSGLIADNLNLIGIDMPSEPIKTMVKVRYRAAPVPATVTFTESGFTAVFDEPVRSVTPGQAAVITDGRRVLGGGRIIKQIK